MSFGKRAFIGLSVAVLSGLSSLPAQAVNFSYWPFGYAGYWIWPLTTNMFSLTNPYVSFYRAMAFPFNALNGSTGYYHSPYYWNPSAANTMFPYNGQSGPFSYNGYNGGANTGPYPFGPGAYSGGFSGSLPAPGGMQGQQGGMQVPENGTQGPLGVMQGQQNGTQGPLGGMQGQQGSMQVPENGTQAPQGSMQAQDQALLNGADAALNANPGSTGTAPQLPAGLAPGSSSANQSPLSSALKQLFVDRVNKKFKGDIKNALFDPETRELGRSIGLVGRDDMFDMDLSKAHIVLGKQILADPSLDAAHKLSALSAVLKR